jgi:hypothetical protein
MNTENSSRRREKHRLRVLENRVLRRRFGPKWEKVKRRLEKTAQ